MAELSEEKRKQILEKIRKLLALKEGAEKIGSEGEAYAAAAGVHRLLTEYNLSMADVLQGGDEKSGPEVKQSDGVSYNSHFGVWKKELMIVICKYNYCKLVSSPIIKQMYVVGSEANTAVCKWLYDYLVKAFVQLAKDRFRQFADRFCLAKSDLPLSILKMQIGESRTDEFFYSYYKGTVNGLQENFENRMQQATSDEHSLVVSWSRILDDFFKKGNYQSRRGTVVSHIKNSLAFDKGYDDGATINLDRQIKGTEQRKQLNG